MNFGKFRQNTVKKIKELTEDEKAKFTEKELELKEEQEKLSEEQTKFKDQMVQSYQDDALAVLTGNNEEMRKKVINNYNRITGEAITKEEVATKMRDAFNMLGSQQRIPNPVSLAHNTMGSVSEPGKGRITENEKSLGEKLGITEEEIKKYG